jgi:signal peptidase I
VTGNSLSWNVKRIEPGKKVVLTYQVQPDYTIKQVRESEKDIILKNTAAKVMDKEVSAPAKDIYVLETFNATDIRRIEMAIDALVTANLTAKNSSNKPMSGITLVSMMYSVGFTAGVGLGTTDMDEVFTMIFEKAGENAGGSTGGGEDVTDTATNLLKRVPPHLYGGTAIPAAKDAQFRGARATEVTIQDLISGDLIFVKEVDPNTLKEGDIITYLSQNTESFGETITHKIRKKTTDAEGNPGFITYGTTTGVDDDTIVTFPYILGKYETHLPKVGTFFNFLKTTPGYFVCIFVPFMLLIIYQGVNFFRLFRRYKKEQMDEMKAERDKIEAERLENAKMFSELQALKAQLEGKAAPTTETTPPDENKPAE